MNVTLTTALVVLALIGVLALAAEVRFYWHRRQK